MGTGEGSSYRVTTDYRAAYLDPIVMSAGETLRIGEFDPEHDGWVWCTGQTGKSGWVPQAYIEQRGEVGVALRDYDATELSVRAGEELSASDEVSGWVWATNSHGQSGWVPAEIVERLA
jgi:hypothetical protein